MTQPTVTAVPTVEPPIEPRTIVTRVRVPTQEERAGARRRHAADPRAQHLQHQVQSRSLGGMFDRRGRALAEYTRQETQVDFSQSHYTERLRLIAALRSLGISTGGRGHVHVQEYDAGHAQMVTRAISNPTSLIDRGDISVGVDQDPPLHPEITAAQTERIEAVRAGIPRGEVSMDRLIEGAAFGFEKDLLYKASWVRRARDRMPDDGEPTFLNFSWGHSLSIGVNNATNALLDADEGTEGYREVVEILGRPPTDSDEDYRAVAAVVADRMKAHFATPEVKARLGGARLLLEEELAEGRRQNLLVFQGAGNHYGLAKDKMPSTDLSIMSTNGVEGLITVGAVDRKGPGAEDDEVAFFSAEGDITVSMDGTALPFGNRGENIRGTSFASPLAMEVAYAMANANPELDADDIARLLADPRVARDIEGTDRDGAGAIDPFAAVLVAKYPSITSERIEQLRERHVPENAFEAAAQLVGELGTSARR